MTVTALINGEDLGYGGRTVLAGVSFSLTAGDRVALLGRSGAGKSTLLKTLYDRLVGLNRRVALVPQEHALVPQLSAFHNTYMGRLDEHGFVYNLRNLLLPMQQERTRIAPVLDAVGLPAVIDRPVEQLSGGQKQRVALARAFFRGGDILLGDEPLSAVDGHLADVLITEVKQRFPTSVVAMHDVDMALHYATRVIGIARGRIVFDAPRADVHRGTIDALYS